MCKAALAYVVPPLGEALAGSIFHGEREMEMLGEFFVVYFKNQDSVLLSNDSDDLLPCLLITE